MSINTYTAEVSYTGRFGLKPQNIKSVNKYMTLPVKIERIMLDYASIKEIFDSIGSGTVNMCVMSVKTLLLPGDVAVSTLLMGDLCEGRGSSLFSAA